MRVVFVHGACVRDGAWWWHRTAERLAERDVTSEAPALPSCGEAGRTPDAHGRGLADDVAAVRSVLTAGDEPTVVIAHGYGGGVTAEAAAGVDTERHLLLVSSYLPEVGESLSSFGGEAPAPFLDIDPEGGTFTVRADAMAETFLQDCDPRIQREAADRTARQSLAVLGEPVRSAAREQLPSTYLVCARDRGTPAERQRAFARGRAGSWRSTPGTTRSSRDRWRSTISSSGCERRRRAGGPSRAVGDDVDATADCHIDRNVEHVRQMLRALEPFERRRVEAPALVLFARAGAARRQAVFRG